MIAAMQLSELQGRTRGVLYGDDVAFSSISTDTRTLTAGDLFVALQGERFDGNTYVGEAEKAGAVAAVVSRTTEAGVPRLQVADTTDALGKIAAFNRQLSQACVIGITGSQGKTTVKEMVGIILSRCGSTLVTRANLNNTIGVPMTLLEMKADHKYAVVEMGANMQGEIARSVSCARPDIAHITNVAGTHLEGFGSLQGVASAKSEIWSGLAEGGTAVINLDDQFAADWVRANASHRCITISATGSNEADYAVTGYTLNPLGNTAATLRTPFGQVDISLPLPGMHNLANALAATAIAMEAGADSEQVQDGLAAMQPVRGRMQFLAGNNGAVIIDDSYNASPASFRAAIDVLASCAGTTVLVMGDMGELGADAGTMHADIGSYARSRGVQHLLAVGTLSREAVAAFGDEAQHFSSQEVLLDDLHQKLREGVTVLVKGSRSAGMDKLIPPLTSGEG